MQNVAVYEEKNRPYITIFSFSKETNQLILELCDKFNISIKQVSVGSKEGSLRFKLFTTKSFFNECLNG